MRKELYLDESHSVNIKVIQGAYNIFEFVIFAGDKTNYAPVDLTNATITFYAICKEDKTQKFSGIMASSQPTLGYVEYTVQSLNFPVVGSYKCEIVIEKGESLPRKIQRIEIEVKESISEQFEGE